ncbi:phospholipase D1-like isoform X4 [Macrobrachium nipponense]|uniref:phospholipase D1-like isoform X4 n=1 Tax=Macrobrachium nipponense TaxID=159736 RepID=UPI0030C82E81
MHSASSSSSCGVGVRIKTFGGNVHQEMEPLASVINSDENYGTVNVGEEQGGLQASSGEGAEKTTIPRVSVEAASVDVQDFSINRAVQGCNGERKGKPQHLPPLRISMVKQNPTLGSPDSDIDILGYLDYTPDSLGIDTLSAGSLSFSNVFQLTKFNELMPEVFVPERPVQLTITRVDSDNSNRGLKIFSSPVLQIELEHGDFKWTIRKKVSQVTNLHSQLIILRTKLKLPAATREARIRRQSMRIQMRRAEKIEEMNEDGGKATHRRMVKYPRRALQSMDKGVLADLQTYLRNILYHPLYRNHQSLIEFLEISPVSFIKELGSKHKEGLVRKRIGSYNSNGCCSWCWSPVTGRYKHKWLVLKETCLFFLTPESGEIRSVMLMDSYFEVSHGYRIIGIRNALLISNLSRSVVFRCDSEASQKEWIKQIHRNQQKYGRDFIHRDRRYDSFAPVRKSSYARWYVDGSRYMWDVAEMLESAREEIFITDWWMSPEIYLKRPDLTGCKWRLAEVLRRQAERGVMVFILLYKEVELALGISSILTKQTVGQLHENIKILRHPDHYAGGVLYWAHHEKMVIIDQMYAFVSGIDLAFGRWDDSRHKLLDVGHAGLQSPQGAQSPSVPQGPQGSTLMHLVKGTNEVLVKTVTQSTPSSRRSSFDNGLSDDHTLSTTLSSIISSQVEVTPDVQVAYRQEDSSKGGKYLEPGGFPSRDSDSVLNDLPGDSSNVNMSSLQSESRYRGEDEDASLKDNVSSYEKASLSSHSMKFVKRKLLRRSTRGDKRTSTATCHQNSDGEEHSEGRVGKGLKEVKKMGLELVEEVKEKGREVRAWTATKLPQLHRRNSSSSEVSDEDEVDNPEHGVKRLGDRHKMGSTSSLAQAHSVLTKEDTTSIHLWVGKDYVNWISKDLTNLDKPFKDIVNRHQTPRMPWHDIGLFVEGPAARDAARHFIQRWNAVKTEKAKPDRYYPYLLPRTYDKASFVPSHLVPKHKVKCQVLRSVGRWSAGLEESEFSILNAYTDLIRQAKHYIYIENQFFITCANMGEAKEVNNSIAQEIVERIVQAHCNNEVFRVYILLPLLPAFEGMIGKSSGVAMQYIVYWNYVSICRGKTSLLQCLKDQGVTDWRKYVSFCSLRNHEELHGRPVSELIYIHSKLMIIDDQYVIAGSANINDRSMIGNRDSEVCLLMEDEEFEQGIMDGKPYESGILAGSLRRYLFCEHLGISEDDEAAIATITDPVSEDLFMKTWSSTAAKNTKIFEEVFSCYPCDSAKTFEDVNRLRNSASMADLNPSEALRKLKDVKGHLVEFPLRFLEYEVLKPGVGTKEYLLPMGTWT